MKKIVVQEGPSALEEPTEKSDQRKEGESPYRLNWIQSLVV